MRYSLVGLCVSQVNAKSGAVKAYYSWKVQNPSEAFYDVMSYVDDHKGSEDVHVGWEDQAEKNAKEVPIFGMNETTLESVLYGAVVGVDGGPNVFTLIYVDSAVQHAGHLLSLIAAFVVLIRNCL